MRFGTFLEKGYLMPLVTLKNGTRVLESVLRHAIPLLKTIKRERPKVYNYLVKRCRGGDPASGNCPEEKIIRAFHFVNVDIGPKDCSIAASIRDIVLAAEDLGGFDDVVQ